MADVAALVIIQLAVYNFIFLIKFSQGLLETKRYLPMVHRVLNGVFLLFADLACGGVVLKELMFHLSTIVLPIVNFGNTIGSDFARLHWYQIIFYKSNYRHILFNSLFDFGGKWNLHHLKYWLWVESILRTQPSAICLFF